MMEDEKEGHDSDEMRDTPQQAQVIFLKTQESSAYIS